MSESRPLSTEDIAGRSQREDTEMTPRSADAASIGNAEVRAGDTGATHESRAEMEQGYNESQMAMDSSPTQPSTTSPEPNAPLMPAESAQAHREHWSEIQARFVDSPKEAVEQADELVAEVIQLVATQFAESRKGLERQWQQGGEASSEDLRQAFLQYRSFFERLLAA